MFFGIAEADWDGWLEHLVAGWAEEPIDAQAWRGVVSLLRWLDCVRRENGPAVMKELCRNPQQMRIDIEHSALLRRLLQGKEPLSHPPPLTCGYPWYELIERGEGTAFEVQECPAEDGIPHLIINQNGQWRILQKVGAQEWIVAYREDGEKFRVWKDPTSREFRCWRLKRLS
jgi:hypothetical protein